MRKLTTLLAVALAPIALAPVELTVPAARAATQNTTQSQPANTTQSASATHHAPKHSATAQTSATHGDKPAHAARHDNKPTHPTATAAHPAHKPAAPPVAAKPATPPPAPAAAAETAKPPPDPNKGTVTGLPIPRFVSLRTDDVNLRSGPGTRYPIEWVYKRRELPVEIEREFEVWRLVRDPDGVKGWVHQATLTGRRSFFVTGAEQVMRESASDTAAAVAKVEAGVVGRIRDCQPASDWCQVQVGDIRGWLKREAFWGALPGEAVGG